MKYPVKDFDCQNKFKNIIEIMIDRQFLQSL